MSLPPATIHIKRKATDEPVDFLRVHEANSKRRRRATDFVFSRQQVSETASDSNSHQQAYPAVRQIKQIHRSASSQSWATRPIEPKISSQGDQYGSHMQLDGIDGEIPDSARREPAVPLLTEKTSPATAARSQNLAQPRRFHISRSSTATVSQSSAGTEAAPQRKRSGKGPTLFIERRTRLKLSEDNKPPPADQNAHTAPASVLSASDLASSKPDNKDRSQKRPGLASRAPPPPTKDTLLPKIPQVPASTLPPRNVRLPSGLMMPWDVNSEQLAAEMQAYTLQEIGQNLADSEAPKPKVTKTPTTTMHKNHQSRFRPKKPVLRYGERHPEEATPVGNYQMDIDDQFEDIENTDEDDDSNYIIDTYIRMPAEILESSEARKDVGLLVLDTQPDIDEFYREDSDSDEEEEDEEEDENAENHYSADYPDEEVDSDDEYDRNAYLYRTHNASDLEEFDENDAAFSDDSVDI